MEQIILCFGEQSCVLQYVWRHHWLLPWVKIIKVNLRNWQEPPSTVHALLHQMSTGWLRDDVLLCPLPSKLPGLKNYNLRRQWPSSVASFWELREQPLTTRCLLEAQHQTGVGNSGGQGLRLRGHHSLLQHTGGHWLILLKCIFYNNLQESIPFKILLMIYGFFTNSHLYSLLLYMHITFISHLTMQEI